MSDPPGDRPVRWRLALGLAALGPVGYGLLALAALSPQRTEALYARGIFPVLRAPLVAMARRSPVSMAETLLGLGLALVIVRCGRGLVAWSRGRRRPADLAAHALAQTLGAGGVALLLFQLLWGLNHARLPVAEQLGLTLGETSTAELERVTAALAAEASRRRQSLGRAAEGALALDAPEVLDALEGAWSAAARAHPFLGGPAPLVRRPLVSPLFTWLGLAGIYSPFTGEAHVNGGLPGPGLVFAACHEVAHQRGFAREDEASFLAYLVCSGARDPALRYSASLGALNHCLGALWDADPPRARAIADSLAPGVRADRARAREFWRAGRTPLASLARRTNDLYLRGQGERRGTASYGAVVDLILAWHRAAGAR